MILIERTNLNGSNWSGKFKCSICGSIKEGRISRYLNKIDCGCTKKLVSKHPAYSIWEAMKQRCYNKKSSMYKWYGSKGITMCEDWVNNSKSFIDWADTSGYIKGLTIDRIDNTKGYFPENCQWLTRVENLDKDRQARKPISKISKGLFTNLKGASSQGFNSTELGKMFNLSPRYVRQLLSGDFVPRTLL